MRTAVCWGPAALWAAGIFLVSHQSRPLGLTEIPHLLSYPAHFLEYLVLGATLVWGVTGALDRPLTLRAVQLSWAAVLLYAFSDEIHQWFVPGRQPSWQDILADCLGASVCFAAAYRRWSDPGPKD